MIIIIKKLDPSFVCFPKPAIASVKIQGHNVEQNNPCINTQRDRTKKIILPHISKEIKNKALQSLMEESDSNSDDLSIDEIRK